MYSSEAQLQHLRLDPPAQTYMLELLRGIYNGYSGNVARALKLDDLQAEFQDSEARSSEQSTAPRRLLGSTLTCSIPVTKEMVNVAGGLHGGCQAYLVDLCTSLAMVPFRSVESWDVTGLSLNLSLNFLGAARTGSTLRIISRTTNVGRNVASIACRVEVIPVVGVASASATSTTTSTTTTNNQQYAKVVATGSHLKFNAFAKSSGRQEVEVAQQEDREVRDASTRGFKTFPRAASSAL